MCIGNKELSLQLGMGFRLLEVVADIIHRTKVFFYIFIQKHYVSDTAHFIGFSAFYGNPFRDVCSSSLSLCPAFPLMAPRVRTGHIRQRLHASTGTNWSQAKAPTFFTDHLFKCGKTALRASSAASIQSFLSPLPPFLLSSLPHRLWLLFPSFFLVIITIGD